MKTWTAGLYIAVFLLIVPVLGLVSVYKYYHFKLTGTVDYNEWNVSLGSKLETDIASSFFRKLSFIDLNGAMRTVLGQREMNGIYKLNNGKLVMPSGRTSDEALAITADKLLAFRDYLAASGTQLLYVALPYDDSNYDPQIPAGFEDYDNDNHNRFLPMLRDRGIDTIDLREEMHRDGIDHFDMIYMTDTHWNTQAGLYAYNKIADYMTEKTGCIIDERIGKEENYTVTVYEDHHLGYYGQRTGRFFGGIDDFTLYEPNFPTLVQRIMGEGITEPGSLQAVFLDKTPLQKKDYSSRYTYDIVLGGMPISGNRFLNHMSENETRILVISHSFYKAVSPFLITAFKDVQYAHYSEVEHTITHANMEANHYDAVILMYDPGLGGYDPAFAFLTQ